jgi:hypothetical protein
MSPKTTSPRPERHPGRGQSQDSLQSESTRNSHLNQAPTSESRRIAVHVPGTHRFGTEMFPVSEATFAEMCWNILGRRHDPDLLRALDLHEFRLVCARHIEPRRSGLPTLFTPDLTRQVRAAASLAGWTVGGGR